MDRPIVVMMLMCAFGLSVFSIAWRLTDSPKSTRESSAPHEYNLTTIEHDGHRFVILRHGYAVAIVVHPNDGKAEKP